MIFLLLTLLLSLRENNHSFRFKRQLYFYFIFHSDNKFLLVYELQLAGIYATFYSPMCCGILSQHFITYHDNTSIQITRISFRYLLKSPYSFGNYLFLGAKLSYLHQARAFIITPSLCATFRFIIKKPFTIWIFTNFNTIAVTIFD